MSEIRLADDDKDRKYRIRINEDGEEELEIIARDDEPQEEEEYVEFEAYNDEIDEPTDEEAEELARAAKEEQERAAREEAQSLIQKAKERIAEGDVQFALVALDSAQQAWEEEWEIYALKLELITNYFTDFTQAEECIDLSEGYKKYVPEEVKAEFRAKYSANIAAEQQKRQAAADEVSALNEEKKAERRVRFKARRAKSLKNLLIAVVPFIAVLGVAIGLSPYMIYDNGILAAAIVMYALAFVGFVACVILLRVYARDAHRVKVNELDTSTALGRQYLENAELADALKGLYEVITEETKAEAAETDDAAAEDLAQVTEESPEDQSDAN